MKRFTARSLNIVGWLLTPVVAWAVSFLGGWIGAVLGAGAASDGWALRALGLGAIVGALVGAVIWVLIMRRLIVPRLKPGLGTAQP